MVTKIIKININELSWEELGILHTMQLLTHDGEIIQLRDLYELTTDSSQRTTELLLKLSKRGCLPELEINPNDGLVKDMLVQGFTEAGNVSQN